MELVIGLGIPIVTAVVWIAYKHSAAYPPICIILVVLVCVAQIAVMTWNFGLMRARGALSAFIPSEYYGPSRAAIEELSVFDSPVWMLVPIGVVAFLILLMYLPQILGLEDKTEDQDRLEK